MKTILKILLVDDHDAIIIGLKAYFSFFNDKYNLQFESAYSLEEAKHKMLKIKHKGSFELAIIDLDIKRDAKSSPSFVGPELIAHIKKETSNTKVIAFTKYYDSARVKMLIDYKPAETGYKVDGIMNKDAINIDYFVKAVSKVLGGDSYYCITTKAALKLIEEYGFDIIDLKILHYLGKGNRINEISENVFLSESGVKARLINLRKKLEVSDNKFLTKKARSIRIIGE